MSKKIVIFGTGSFAQVVHFYLTHDSDYHVCAFCVHREFITQNEFQNLPVVAFEDVQQHYPPGEYQMFVAAGYRRLNRLRAEICEEARQKGYRLISYVNSKCTHWGDTVMGDNCFVFEDNTIQPFVTIGNDVILWSGNHIGHHATIGDHCFITSHVVISGHVRVGAYCFVGVNSTLRDNITIGEANIIGAGALILKSTSDKQVFAAKPTLAHSLTSDQVPF